MAEPMDQSTDPEIRHLEKTAALLLRFVEAMLDALSEAAASARQAGDVAKAERMESYIRQHRIGLLERQAQLAVVGTQPGADPEFTPR